jgi:ribonuclease T2
MIGRIVILAVLLTLPAASGTNHRRKTRAGSAGNFDYYVLALSWSPEYCHGHPDNAQCSTSKHFGFVVHGLWPEYTSGSGPQNCSTAPGLNNPSQMLDIMPDLQLIAHEWATHGTCSGLTPDSYFALIRKAYSSVKIPPLFQAPTQQQTVSPEQVTQAFSQANLKLPGNAVEVSCPSNYLSEVEICLDKSLNAMACTMPPRCRAKSIRVPPVP